MVGAGWWLGCCRWVVAAVVGAWGGVVGGVVAGGGAVGGVVAGGGAMAAGCRRVVELVVEVRVRVGVVVVVVVGGEGGGTEGVVLGC